MIRSPRAEMDEFLQSRTAHPYRTIGARLDPALDLVRELAGAGGLDLQGGLGANLLVATTAGTMRPTCLAPRSMIADWDGKRVLAVGIAGYRDFEPALFAAAFPGAAGAMGVTVAARAVVVDVAAFHRRHLGGMELARLLDAPSVRAELVAALAPHLDGVDIVALPAVVGLVEHVAAHAELSRDLGTPVVELATLPPSVPGIRLQRALSESIRRHGGRTMVGPLVRAGIQAGKVDHVEIQSSARVLRRPVSRLVLATGGLASGGLRMEPSGGVVETCAGVSVRTPEGEVSSWFAGGFLGDTAQPASRIGVAVDGSMRPLSAAGDVEIENLFACGDLLAGAERSQEKSAEGIACASAMLAGEGAAG
jgi:glycerol-3-phosphate dehydrogenase subunit B